ncbi:uncharacterized protein LOC115395750 [Salarias fasciatus]|uniref:uncharacterized protein LOC115395750 n=1 Tax=Salarias fasciatus TaxID=181472 RepID=UPI001176FA08|nr:uncharacterized protein LOC115395750 [Salarias fasciatus]
MPPLQSSASALRGLNNSRRPACAASLQHLGLLRSSRPPDRGSGRSFSHHIASENAIPSIWSHRSATSALRHHNNPHTTPPGFTCIDNPGSDGRGGGTAVIFNKDIKLTPISLTNTHSFEHTAFKLSGPSPLVTAVIYRPPKPNTSFLSELTDFLTQLSAISSSILLLGDFNFHIDNPNSKPAAEFLDLLTCFKYVNFPTHNHGHILDLICSTGPTIHNLSSHNLNISDHLAITFSIHIPLTAPKTKREITFRNLKSIDPPALSALLTTKLTTSPPPPSDNPSDLVSHCNNTLSSCLDELAPTKTKTVSFTHTAPRYTPELHQMKSSKRQLERLCKKSGLTVHLQIYTEYIQQYKDALNSARSCYYSNLIHSGSNNPKLTQILSGIKTPTCSLDPIPSSLIKTCLPIISPLITQIINSSLSSGSVPQSLKLAAITPILKKPGLDPDNPANFRPISNLPFLSKVLERVIASQLQTHLSSNSLYEPFQSGFRSKHSTETALLKITNDLLLSSDSGHLNILILLELTAAFDTISHSILLSRLKSTLNITGSALSWFQSYLSDRQQFVHINRCSSSIAPLPQGVPQGSVLGPLLFILYILPLGNIIRRHGLRFHCYADDIQLYISTTSIHPNIHSTLTQCLTDITTWMNHNFLKLNSDKTDIIIIGPHNITKSAQQFTLDNSTLTPSPLIRNLGVLLDPTLSFDPHIKHITRTAFFHLKNIARLCPSLSFSAAETLVHAFITSRIDYCNSILYGTPSKTLNKLQYIQNSAARLLTHTRSREHITPVLHKLHWLPVPQRIHFKLLLITFRALHHLAPPYLTDLLHLHTPSRSLRSSSSTSTLLSLPCRTRKRAVSRVTLSCRDVDALTALCKI